MFVAFPIGKPVSTFPGNAIGPGETFYGVSYSDLKTAHAGVVALFNIGKYALAWISTERNSPHIMSLKSTNFSGISFRTCYAHWCADSLVARRHFALSRFDFRSFRVSVGKMTPGRGGYQSTNLPYTNEQIPESYESLADSNVRGIYFRGNPG